MDKITRTIETTIINGVEIITVDNSVTQKELPDLIVSGKIDEKDAIKMLRKTYGKLKNFAVIGLTYQVKKYEMPLNLFIENATEVKE